MKLMARVTADDVENVRDALDVAIREREQGGRARGRLAGKTAANVWSVLTSGFRAASGSKSRELRILPRGHVNPCLGVQPPEGGSMRRARKRWYCRCSRR